MPDLIYLLVAGMFLAGCLWLAAFLVAKSIEQAADIGGDE